MNCSVGELVSIAIWTELNLSMTKAEVNLPQLAESRLCRAEAIAGERKGREAIARIVGQMFNELHKKKWRVEGGGRT